MDYTLLHETAPPDLSKFISSHLPRTQVALEAFTYSIALSAFTAPGFSSFTQQLKCYHFRGLTTGAFVFFKALTIICKFVGFVSLLSVITTKL